MDKRGSLTVEEENQLADLLRRAQWPLPSNVFAAAVNKFVTTPIELIVMDDQEQVLMFYRKDEEYDGFHIPGTVLRDNEDVPTAIQRLIKSEVVGGEVTKPIPLGWLEVHKGNGFGQNSTRHEISLLHFCRLTEPYKGSGEFFPIKQLPDNTLSHHQVIIEEIMRRIKGN